MKDVTLNYDKFRELGPRDMARFLGLDTDGEERSVCTVCATLDNCHGGCLLGVLTWFTQRVTTDEWVKLLKKKGIRK